MVVDDRADGRGKEGILGSPARAVDLFRIPKTELPFPT
jgi:hypothetical protein